MSAPTLDDLAALVAGSCEARLAGLLSREDHAVVIADVDVKLTENGWTWDEISAIVHTMSP